MILNSNKEDVNERSVEDLEYHADMADLVGADVINIHGGPAYGDKEASLIKLAEGIEKLPPRVKNYLTLENDDKIQKK